MHYLLQRQLKHNLGKDFDFSNLDITFKTLLKDISITYEKNELENKNEKNHFLSNNEELNRLLRDKILLLETKTQENKEIINLLNQYKNAINESFIVCNIGVDKTVKYVNENFCKLSGYRKEELLNKPYNLNKTIIKYIDKTLESKKISNTTVLNLKKNAEIYYLNITFIPLLNRKKEIREIIYFATDVTQQMLHQEEIESQRKRINSIFNNQENIVIIVDEKKGIVEVNKKFFETFDFDSLEEYKKSNLEFSELFIKDNLYFNEKLNETQWFKQFIIKTNHIYKITKLDKFGQNQIFSIHCKSIVLNAKTHYICTLIDITELENAREKAEIAQKAKSIFLANMSHEIRTPLNAIMGFSNILSESNIDKENKENANIIARSAKSLLNIINDVLDISKIESGKIDIINEVFVFETFIENIVELFSVAAKEKNLRFIYSPDYDLPYSLISDSMRLQQVLSNLLSNAIKFTPQNGDIIFSIKILEKKENIIKLRFLIKDSGIGMSKEQKKIIFDPFLQADDGISRKYGGTGLGLSICSDIIKLMNSKIEVKSKINEGSEFSFDLELEIDKQQENSEKIALDKYKFLLFCEDENNEFLKSNLQQHIQKLGKVFEYSKENKNADVLFCCFCEKLETILKEFKENNEKSLIVYIGNKKDLKTNDLKYIDNYINLPIYGSKLYNTISEKLKLNNSVLKKVSKKEIKLNARVLVAEDNLNNQKLIQILLNKVGIKPTIVSNGEEAFEAYKKEMFDLILMDINMPIMDGLSCTRKIKKLEQNLSYSVPIIALTANSIAGDKERYLNEGMSDYLSKPIEYNILVDILNKYLLNTSIKSEKSKDNKKTEINTLSKKLQIPFELSEKLYMKFIDEIVGDLEELENFINEYKKDKIDQKIYYIKNSCLNMNLKQAIEILELMENKDSKIELLVEFKKLNSLIKNKYEL